MGACLTTNDSLHQSSIHNHHHHHHIASNSNNIHQQNVNGTMTTITEDNNRSSNNNHLSLSQTNTSSLSTSSPTNHHRNNSYCQDWLKFPICCPYCSNHSEPLSEFQLVILGPGYTGKTTLRHHLVQRYGHAFCKADFLMYRDILQHNVLDLFRDLLQKPSLSFNQLKEFITYIHKQSAHEFELLSSEYYGSFHDKIEEEQKVDNDDDEHVMSHGHAMSIGDELDLGLHDLDSSDTEDFDDPNYEPTPNKISSHSIGSLSMIDEKIQNKKQRYNNNKKMNFKAVNSNSTTSTNTSSTFEQHLSLSAHSTISCTTIEEEKEEEEDQHKLSIFLNDNKHQSMNMNMNMMTNEDMMTQKKLIKELMDSKHNKINIKHALNISVTSIDDDDDIKEYDSDYGTSYNDKYSAINQQCTPSVNSIGDDNNNHIRAYNVNINIESQANLNSNSNSNQLKPSLLFGKLDQLSHSETYQSQSMESMHSMTDCNDQSMIVTDPDHDIDTKSEIVNNNRNEKIIIRRKSEQIHTNHNNQKKLKQKNKKWFNFLSPQSSLTDNNDGIISRRRSTISALFNSFMNHNNHAKKDSMDKPHGNDDDDEDLNAKFEAIDDDEDDGLVLTNYGNNRCTIISERNEREIETYGISSLSELIHRLNNEDLKYGRDNGKYLILNSYRILNDEFEPTFIDLLQCHVRSTGLMFENHVMCRSLPIGNYNKINGIQEKQDIVFRVVDVGGHRNERKKWTYVLKQENDAIVFVVSAASFCQVLFEDFKKNAMRESLDVWKDIISGQHFQQTQLSQSDDDDNNNNDNNNNYINKNENAQFILVINKIDLFYQRCHLFHKYFPEYDGDINNKYEILNYIKSLYLDIAKKYNKTNVHCICTKLTDSLELASFDVEQIKHILLNYKIENNDDCCDILNTDIVDVIIDYAIGDVFWSDKWLKPMWERKMMKNKLLPPPSSSSSNKKRRKKSKSVDITHDNNNINNEYRLRRKRSSRNRNISRSRTSFAHRISSIFQSKQD